MIEFGVKIIVSIEIGVRNSKVALSGNLHFGRFLEILSLHSFPNFEAAAEFLGDLCYSRILKKMPRRRIFWGSCIFRNFKNERGGGFFGGVS